MIDEKRIEAAAAAVRDKCAEIEHRPGVKDPDAMWFAEEYARAALAAADAVTAETHWLAPNEVTDEMRAAGAEAIRSLDVDRGDYQNNPGMDGQLRNEALRSWCAMRDAYLSSPVESQDRKAS